MSAQARGREVTEDEPIDFDKPIMVTQDMYMNILQNTEACQTLSECGVDVVALADLANYIFPKSGDIELTSFLQLILQFRGSNTATVKDIIDMRKFMVEELKDAHRKMFTEA